jgi:hypothetical protein
MTEQSMTLTQYLDKIGVDLNGDFLREGARLMAQMAMEWEVKQQIGAGRYERSALRTNQRNGYRERPWDTRVGSILLDVPPALGERAREAAVRDVFLEPAGTPPACGEGASGRYPAGIHRGGEHPQGR